MTVTDKYFETLAEECFRSVDWTDFCDREERWEFAAETINRYAFAPTVLSELTLEIEARLRDWETAEDKSYCCCLECDEYIPVDVLGVGIEDRPTCVLCDECVEGYYKCECDAVFAERKNMRNCFCRRRRC